MMSFLPGIDVLLQQRAHLIKGARIGLIAHPASRSVMGISTPELLWKHEACDLSCLLGPEHGYFGKADAGTKINDKLHPDWSIPIYSLYGSNRKPSSEALEQVDILLFDIQGLAARCYTYLSTLFYVMEAAAKAKKTLIVTDRPVPLPNTVDGPLLDASLKSFVGLLNLPLVYGMTFGEVAGWIMETHQIKVDLKVIPMQAYHREARPKSDWLPWVSPSPAIVNWSGGECYAITVYTEAIPSLACARGTEYSFQTLEAPWIDVDVMRNELSKLELPGLSITPVQSTGKNGIRFFIDDPDSVRPVTTGMLTLKMLHTHHGSQLWGHSKTRKQFFDQLVGTSNAWESIHTDDSIALLLLDWEKESESFKKERKRFLLYEQQV